MGCIEEISDKIAAIIIKQGLDYNQTKAVFKAARQKADLQPDKKPTGAVERLTLEEELKFIDQAYQESGSIGLMMQTLLETGCRVSEFIELRIEQISFTERLITIERGKGGKDGKYPFEVNYPIR